ncbi:hypothetical protein DAEQUDRAFT_726676 [Daedalea quercina L-15889]|uniref:Cytochrome P450 n=1 Tax=Daedalea quercina L-15889 TaxID=1314783 RepID=A0A165QFB1_9APHY|nr:hypothetical protein DAEQUDRAFT_726676 [Daedalea quercina L-15889]
MLNLPSKAELKRNDLPPRLPRLPILRNVHQLPLLDQHKTFMEWATRYGDIVYTEFSTKPVIIFSSAKATYDLLEKRGVKYSSRLRFVCIVEMIDWSRNVAFRKSDNTWRRHRKWYQHNRHATRTIQTTSGPPHSGGHSIK